MLAYQKVPHPLSPSPNVPSLVQCTLTMPTSSIALASRCSGDTVVLNVVAVVGAVIVMVGTLASIVATNVIVMLAIIVLPTSSMAVTSMLLAPSARGMSADHALVPLAVP